MPPGKGMVGELLIAVLFLSCDNAQEPVALKVSPKQNRWDNQTISEHHFSQAPVAEKRPIGAACKTCMRVLPGTHICTHFCSADADCPTDWSCRTPVPSREVRVCVPKRVEVAQ